MEQRKTLEKMWATISVRNDPRCSLSGNTSPVTAPAAAISTDAVACPRSSPDVSKRPAAPPLFAAGDDHPLLLTAARHNARAVDGFRQHASVRSRPLCLSGWPGQRLFGAWKIGARTFQQWRPSTRLAETFHQRRFEEMLGKIARASCTSRPTSWRDEPCSNARAAAQRISSASFRRAQEASSSARSNTEDCEEKNSSKARCRCR